MEPRSETWESFWAQTLRIDFFQGKWDVYDRVANARAEWLEQAFRLDQELPVLSLACGEGGIELALARRGFKVTGIDRCGTFVHFARDRAKKEDLNATFLVADLASERPMPAGNGMVCCFDTLGLLDGEAEAKLVRRMAQALAPGGLLLVDSPQRSSIKPTRTWSPLNDGYLLMETRWDAPSGMQHIEPLFIEPEGGRVILHDPYDSERGDYTGVSRYVYAAQELVELVQAAGLPARELAHQRHGYFMVAGGEGLEM